MGQEDHSNTNAESERGEVDTSSLHQPSSSRELTLWRRVEQTIAPFILFVCSYLATFLLLSRVIPPQSLIAAQVASCLAVIAATAVSVLLIDRSARWLRVSRHETSRDIFEGLIGGALLIGIADLFVQLTTQHSRNFTGSVSADELFLLLIPAALHEELLLRGYLFEKLQLISRSVALVFTSAVFGVMHIGNDAVSAFAIANIILGGVLIAFLRFRRGTLWLPFVFHWTWNAVSGPLLGYEVSGHRMQQPLFREHDPGPAIFTGGWFGIEASCWVTVTLVAAIASLVWAQMKSSKFKLQSSKG